MPDDPLPLPPLDVPPPEVATRQYMHRTLGRSADPYLARRADHLRRHGRPLFDDIPPHPNQRTLYVWAVRMGLACRVPLIGYLGLASLTGRQPQTFRKLAAQRSGAVEDMPPAVARILREHCGGREAVLLDRDQALTWLRQTGRLAPDGVTALRLPPPGAGRRRLAA